MRKILGLLLALLTVGAFGACSSGSSSPGKAAKRYAEYIAGGEYDQFIDGIYIPDDVSSEEAEQGKDMIKALLSAVSGQMFEEKGGLEKVEVVSEQLSDDGEKATVTLKYAYGNGESSEESMDLILDDGRWLIDMGI